MSNTIRSSILLGLSVMTAACFAADVEWLNAADGAWGTGANWSGGSVPNSARAVITNSSAGFTVTAAEASNPKIAGLLLKNTGGAYTTSVHIVGHLRSADEALTVGGGGLLHVDGGVLAITNSSAKHIALSGTSATKKGVLRVSDGVLDFRATSAGISGGVNIGSYGRFEATGGRIAITAPNAWNSDKWALYCEVANSEMEIGGTASFEVANRCVDLRCGRHNLKGSARFVCNESNGNVFALKANSSSGAYFTVSDSAVLDMSKMANGFMGSYWWAGASNKSKMAVNGGKVKLPMAFVVGHGNGSSELNISGGETSLTYYGLDVAAYVPDKLADKQQNPNGEVVVSGGSLVVTSASGGQSTTAKKLISGFVVGNGSQITAAYSTTSGYSCTGALNVSGGVVTNGVGLFVVGAGRATGRVLQTGGTVYHGLGFTTTDWRNSTPMIVGFAGGDGTYVMSNGIMVADAPIYVGGVVTNVLNRLPISYWPGSAFTDRSAVGKLVVAGGSLSTKTSDLVVGADGFGTLEIGPDATVLIGNPNGSGSIILSNRTASVTRFVLGRDSAGRLTTPNVLVVASGAKLEVDVSDYAGEDRWVKLIGCKRREGSFGAGDVTVVGKCERGTCEVVQNRAGDATGSVWLHVRRGSIIMVL